MGPEDYQQPPLPAQQGQVAGQALPPFVAQHQAAKPPSVMQTILSRLRVINSVICDKREQLIALNEQLGTPHIPTNSAEQPKPSQTTEPGSGAIQEAFVMLDLIDSNIRDIAYQLERLQQL